MLRYRHLFFVLFIISAIVGCGESGGVVATEDEMKAHVEKYGDLELDPAASTDLVD